jgi:DNA polymerase-3 subunit delta'
MTIDSVFTPVLGQPQAVEILTQAVYQQRVAPAYLFYGPEGVGKSLTARCFLELLLCHQVSATQHPIIRQKLQQGNHPDVLWVEPTYNYRGTLLSAAEAATAGVKRKAPPQIRIEQIREIGQFLSRPPLFGSRSVVVIEQAETMAEGAANALLKTLEEPGQATLVLISPGVESLLPTLISRCQRIPFYRLSPSLLVEILTNSERGLILDCPEIIGIAQGSPGEAIYLWEQLQMIEPELLDRVKKLPTSLREALELASQIDRELETTEQFWLLDYLQYTYWQKYQNPRLIQALEQARNHLSAYVQPRLVWECALLELDLIAKNFSKLF